MGVFDLCHHQSQRFQVVSLAAGSPRQRLAQLLVPVEPHFRKIGAEIFYRIPCHDKVGIHFRAIRRCGGFRRAEEVLQCFRIARRIGSAPCVVQGQRYVSIQPLGQPFRPVFAARGVSFEKLHAGRKQVVHPDVVSSRRVGPIPVATAFVNRGRRFFARF